MADKVIKQVHPQGLVLPSLPGQIKELRVAAYARVSTSSDEQLGSVAAQKDYFEKLIIKKPGWILVDIYADEGITGTSMHHRDAFKRMITDAIAGKIDLIITKSLSRFARNTVDTLNTIRQLKDVNVGVYFEKEDIFTLDSKGEFMITLLSSIAEEESRSISENVKWGHRKKFADGKYQLAYKNFLGFCKDPHGSLAIVEEEAQIVRLIYYLFLSGYTVNAIAVMLTKANIPTPARRQIWQNSTVQSILTNEKYYGAALLQKGYSVDYRTKKRKLNHGELPMYYIANDHPGIVTKEIFDEVQQRLMHRPYRTKTTTLFANQLYCSDCGSSFTPLSWHSTTTNDTVWKCRNRRMHGYKCATPHLYEELLKPIYHQSILQLLRERPSIIEDCIAILDKVTGIHDFINKYEILWSTWVTVIILIPPSSFWTTITVGSVSLWVRSPNPPPGVGRGGLNLYDLIPVQRAWGLTQIIANSNGELPQNQSITKEKTTMNDQKTYNEMMARLDAIAETIPEKQAEKAAAAIRKAEIYNEAFWDTMHTGMPHNALKEGSDGSGGYLVPDTYEDKLVKALAGKNVLRRISNVIQTSHRLHIPVAENVDCADWVPEGTAIKFMDAEFGEVILDAYKLVTSIRATDEMLEDGGVDLEKFILNMFSERIGKAEEEAFIRGDGNGKPLGLIYQAPVGAVSEDTGDISLDDMLELEYSVKSAYRKKAVWVMSEDAYNRLRRINRYQGRPVWRNGLEKGDPKQLFGHPVYVCRALDDVAPDSIPVLFGDFSYFWIGDRGKRVIKRLVERYADRGQVAFITSERVDAKLVLPEAVKMLKVKVA